MNTARNVIVTLALSAPLLVAGCGDSNDSGTAAPAEAAEGLVVVAPETAAATIADPPADLVILDVRTPEEFAEGHIEGATLLDFYEPTFAADLAALDPDQPYVIYCRSGNRSGQTRAIMADLGFRTVADVDGGIVAWQAAGLPLAGG